MKILKTHISPQQHSPQEHSCTYHLASAVKGITGYIQNKEEKQLHGLYQREETFRT